MTVEHLVVVQVILVIGGVGCGLAGLVVLRRARTRSREIGLQISELAERLDRVESWQGSLQDQVERLRERAASADQDMAARFEHVERVLEARHEALGARLDRAALAAKVDRAELSARLAEARGRVTSEGSVLLRGHLGRARAAVAGAGSGTSDEESGT